MTLVTNSEIVWVVKDYERVLFIDNKLGDRVLAQEINDKLVQLWEDYPIVFKEFAMNCKARKQVKIDESSKEILKQFKFMDVASEKIDDEVLRIACLILIKDSSEPCGYKFQHPIKIIQKRRCSIL